MKETNNLLEVKSVTKKYSSGFQLNAQSFTLTKGQVTAFLGPNGAGKSTLFQLLTGNLDASTGEIFLKGQKLTPESCTLKRNIGYLPQNIQLPRWVTGQEILNYGASLYQLKNSKEKIASLISAWDCSSYINRPLAACSHGMQKRIGLALSTIHSPDLLILDEPFSGLDLLHMRTLEHLILDRAEKGQATILSTHISSYVAKLSHEVFVLKLGTIKKLNTWTSEPLLSRISIIENEFFHDRDLEKK